MQLTVEALIEKLKAMPPKADVFISRDMEGNGFNAAFSVEQDVEDDDGGNMEVVIWA